MTFPPQGLWLSRWTRMVVALALEVNRHHVFLSHRGRDPLITTRRVSAHLQSDGWVRQRRACRGFFVSIRHDLCAVTDAHVRSRRRRQWQAVPRLPLATANQGVRHFKGRVFFFFLPTLEIISLLFIVNSIIIPQGTKRHCGAYVNGCTP